jgi:hypothetical protein
MYNHVILFFDYGNIFISSIQPGFTSRRRMRKQVDLSFQQFAPLPFYRKGLSEAQSFDFSCDFSTSEGVRVTRRRHALAVLIIFLLFLLFGRESKNMCYEKRIITHWGRGRAKDDSRPRTGLSPAPLWPFHGFLGFRRNGVHALYRGTSTSLKKQSC